MQEKTQQLFIGKVFIFPICNDTMFDSREVHFFCGQYHFMKIRYSYLTFHWKVKSLFIEVKLMEDGFFGFLKQVASVTRLENF